MTGISVLIMVLSVCSRGTPRNRVWSRSIGSMVLPFEVVKPLTQELGQLFITDLEMMCLDDNRVDFVRKHFAPHLFLEWRIVFGDEAPFPRRSLNHSLAFKFGISLGHSIAIQPQFFGEGPNR